MHTICHATKGFLLLLFLLVVLDPLFFSRDLVHLLVIHSFFMLLLTVGLLVVEIWCQRLSTE
ncbi:hypothetical protein [Alkalimonas amylolytica]|uniref:Uncharacterized protein n=1 Tax=Alkalimonas amylolytica TaxID=152573 RepID=A0A1H4BIK0_ALKAM|nr:hypothetical protein [Alkalimonas amylolytica]SEA47874.1 hypothetical protein SAMN04488051_103376 [Alkalimonas amylolytica]